MPPATKSALFVYKLFKKEQTMMTSQAQIRDAFWRAHPDADRKRYPARDWTRQDKSQRDYCTDTRCAFVDFLDFLHRDGQISAALANRANL
jgi:hypothetical protein